MDTLAKIRRHQEIIIGLLKERAQYVPANLQDCENQVVADKERNHYLLITSGWDDDAKVQSTVFQLDIKPDGKIWLQSNWSDTDVAELLVQKGVARSDIVIGFYPEFMRQGTDYAVA